MTRVFLAAGVAALAIAAPANAGPGGHGDRHGGGGGGQPAFHQGGGGGGGGGQRAQFAARRGGGGGGFAAPRMQRQSFAPRMQRMERGPRFAQAQRPQRMQHVQSFQQRGGHAQTRMAARQQVRANHVQPQQRMASRQQARVNHVQAQNRAQLRANRVQQAQNLRTQRMQGQNRMAARQQLQNNRVNQAQNRMAMRQQLQNNRMNPAQNRMAMRQQMQNNRINQAQNRVAVNQQFRGNAHTLLAERQALRADRIANVGAFRASRFAALASTPRVRVVEPAQAVRFVGQPVNVVNNFVGLSALPASVSYLYPSTPDYYYQYGGGYLYEVDRRTSLIDALIPLLAGGFLPGTYLPQPYMSSYVPNYYGLNSFYPASYGYGGYGGYGYAGYGYNDNVCNRYAYGNIYQVDCYTGMVLNVIPMYAGGYGVGQMLPSAYSYYNVPMQYRSMYYPTADYSYWYAPGAIYQYDTRSSLITSVAALMSPGFTVGQPIPAGYGMYNVPMAYRATYYDTPNAWYRYNNGYIYQVDPTSMVVTAVVASLLT
jgi:hypothetical protein